MKKRLLSLLLASIVLTGCKTEPEHINIQTSREVQVPLDDNKMLTVTVEDLPIIETDNCVYWKLEDGTTIYKMSSQISSATYNEQLGVKETNTSLSKDIDGSSIVISTASEKLKWYGEQKFKTHSTDINLYPENKINKLPQFEEKDMIVLSNNLYMPEGTKEYDGSAYLSSVYTDGDKWLSSWIFSGDKDAIKKTGANICLANSGVKNVTEWYFDESILYLRAENNIFAAKKLQYNEWCVYYGDITYLDYLLTGVTTVHSSL